MNGTRDQLRTEVRSLLSILGPLVNRSMEMEELITLPANATTLPPQTEDLSDPVLPLNASLLLLLSPTLLRTVHVPPIITTARNRLMEMIRKNLETLDYSGKKGLGLRNLSKGHRRFHLQGCLGVWNSSTWLDQSTIGSTRMKRRRTEMRILME